MVFVFFLDSSLSPFVDKCHAVFWVDERRFFILVEMREIIHNYKLRLTNLSQGNRALKLSRLSSRRDVDVRDLGFLEKDRPEALLQKIIAGKDIPLIRRLDPRLEKVNLIDRRLNNIYRELNTLFEETGSYDLYVGYPFVEGKFVDGTSVRCPVLLFPVRLKRSLKGAPRWKLASINDEPVLFNRTFLLAYELYQQLRLPEEIWDEEIERKSDWQAWLNHFYARIKGMELALNFNSDLFKQELRTFRDYSKDEMEAFGVGKLTFQSQAVLGIFPQSDSALLQDYEQIEQQAADFSLERFFPRSDEVYMPSASSEDGYIREEDRYFVTPVDQSQEAALLRIKQGESLVIHGPPGTGKSQVIVNIIADALAHGKKVLLVSQKRAALDVVYKRLSALGLSRFAVLVHDYRHDRKDIYQKIRKQIDGIDDFKKQLADLNLTKWDHDYKILSRQIDQLHRTFEELHMALQTREPYGVSPHELYQKVDTALQILDVGEVATTFDQDKLTYFLEKLRAILDYEELLAEDHPWNDRMSFHHYAHNDGTRLMGLLADLPTQVADLHEVHTTLATNLKGPLLDSQANQAEIEAFNQINSLLETPPIRKDIEAIHKDELTTSYVKKKLGQFERVIEELAEIKVLNDFPWRLYSDLKRHVETYKKYQKAAFRMLSIPFLRARWFLKSVLHAKGLKLDEGTFKDLNREYRFFVRLHQHYTKTYELDFFHDFPLLEELPAKQQWLVKKQNHLAAYKKVDQLKGFKSLHPVFEFGELKVEAWQKSMGHIAALKRFNQLLVKVVGQWRTYLTADQCQRLLKGVAVRDGSKAFIMALQESAQRDFADIKNLDLLLADLSGKEQGAFSALTKDPEWRTHLTSSEAFLHLVENSFHFYWLENLERQYPILEEVSSRGWERKQRSFGEKVAARQTKVTELIQQRSKEKIVGILRYNRLKNPITFRQIYHQVTKKRLIWPIRRLVRETWKTGLNELVPCWMASPESAAAIFPMEKDFFDLVVFDEASQCFVERAVPVLLRGKQSIVAGDDQQLKPFDLYRVKFEDTERDFTASEIALEVESILDLAKRSLEERKLTWHYRSQEEELINFSNHAFYEGKLQVIPPATHDTANYPPMEWVGVKGQWANNRNLIEAEAVVELVERLVQRDDAPSIGIVTFNYHQQELIKDLLEARLEALANEDEALYQCLQLAMMKTESEEFQGLFVKNIENVQGDERDIIIFSIAYAPNESGKLVTRFGLLNQKGGENRLNVAITRAKKKIFVICSFEPSQLKVESALQDGPRVFKSYLQYVRAVSDLRSTDAAHLLNMQSKEDFSIRPENPIADELAGMLAAEGYEIIRDFGDTAYKLDIVVKDGAKDNSFLLGIECEGAHYFSGESSKEREVYRIALLEARGWKTYRVWARNWWMDKEREVKKIQALLP